MREVRRGRVSRWNLALAVVALALLVTAAVGPPAWAIMKYGQIEVSGNVDSLNYVRHSNNAENFQYIMNRNALRLRVDWDWFKNGRLMDRFELPFIERSKLFLLYRGVYDGFYDMAPTDLQRGQTRYDDLIGGPIAGNRPGQCVGGDCAAKFKSNGTLDSLPTLLPGSYSRFDNQLRTDYKFENRLREAYIDLRLKDAPLDFRIGRQQVIWGESDQFRVMDCFNPLDFGWHAEWESWDEIRVPEWIAKGLWRIGWLGPLSNTYLEVLYNPFDYHNGIKYSFLPRPWAIPFADPLRGGQVSNSGFLTTSRFDLQGTSLTQGDFKRNPAEASEVGARFHAVTPQGVEFTLNYLYGRGRGLGGANTLALKIDKVNFPKNPFAFRPKDDAIGFYQDPSLPIAKPVYPVDVTAKLVQPYQHIFGMTANYSDDEFTEAVWRMETAYVMGNPFNTVEPNTLIPVTYTNPASPTGFTPLSAFPCSDPRAQCSPFGFTKRDMWTGMFGFDRPTWIRFLNPRATWFLTGQFFWTYTTGGHIDQLVGSAGAGDAPYFGPVGQWKSGPFAGLVERQQYGSCPGPGCGNGDNIRQWEHLITFAANSFYRAGTVVPSIANAWDPVNDNDLISWNVAYYYSNNFIITLYQNYFFTYGSKAPSNDPEYTGGRFDRRDETGVRLTYQF